MPYYSFVVDSPEPTGVPKPMVMLDTGLNVFSAQVDNIDDFIQHLRDKGVEVKQCTRLDGEALGDPTPQDMLLPGESDARQT